MPDAPNKPLVHQHLLIRAEVRNPPYDPDWAVEWCRSVIEKVGMKVCAGPISKYVMTPGNRGLTVAGILETSHMAMHVWDETDPALLQFDIYTCGELDTNIIIREIMRFDPVRMDCKFLDREHGFREIPVRNTPDSRGNVN